MTFEEYKAFWLEKPEHYKSTDSEILDWYENGIIIYWASNIKTKELSNDSIEKHYKKLNNVSYPCKSFWKIVSEYNIKVLYGLDTHRRATITHLEDLIKFANFIIGDEIINKLQFIDTV